MNIYIFEGIQNLTNNYHSGGGLVVIADSIESALGLAQSEDVQFTGEEIESVQIYSLKGKAEPKVFIFPDAGCC